MGIVEKGLLWSRPPPKQKEGDNLTVSKAQQKAVNKYIAEKLDRVNLTMPKGKKEEIKARADSMGLSVNAFINLAIDTMMERDNGASAVSGGQ